MTTQRKEALRIRLDEAKLKKTRHRTMVLDVLDQENTFLSADDIYLKLKQEDASVSLSTVYRILETFVQTGLVSPIALDDTKPMLYEIAHAHHAHHLICRQCHKVIHVEHCPLEHYETRLEKAHGFTIDEHRLNFYGVCEACANTDQ